jgi:hypothetical protein
MSAAAIQTASSAAVPRACRGRLGMKRSWIFCSFGMDGAVRAFGVATLVIFRYQESESHYFTLALIP